MMPRFGHAICDGKHLNDDEVRIVRQWVRYWPETLPAARLGKSEASQQRYDAAQDELQRRCPSIDEYVTMLRYSTDEDLSDVNYQ